MGLARRAARPAVALPPYRLVPNVNLLRVRSTRRQLSSAGRYSLLLMLLCGVGLGFMLYKQEGASGEKAELGARLASLRAQVSAANAQKGELTRLQSEIARLESGSRDFLKLGSFGSLSGFLGEVQQRSSSARVTLTAIKQHAGGAVVSGWSSSPREALSFHEAMSAAPGVAQCTLSSLSKGSGDAKFSFTLSMTLKGQARP